MSTNPFLWLGVMFVAVSLVISAPVDENDECGVSGFPDGRAGEPTSGTYQCCLECVTKWYYCHKSCQSSETCEIRCSKEAKKCAKSCLDIYHEKCE
ncbi:hypothetical protein DdX_17940 [Ditylenchus destructor]|uniref:Uncharacterized protein n=1 Tax=Ditylenchus destructor TaxID=166010 RepID=A0AAD4MKT5_9BILA|nr:hypothetical protein DdX_17940 [Ditylenchus destructor]